METKLRGVKSGQSSESAMTERKLLLERITSNPAVFEGKPTIRGLAVTVESILDALAAGKSNEEILKDRPELELDDVWACLAYAKAVIAHESLEESGVERLRKTAEYYAAMERFLSRLPFKVEGPWEPYLTKDEIHDRDRDRFR
jgi:uncharacterized protein (DUF433 family)